MTVYVDDVRHPFGRMIMCHCWGDTLEELLVMMDKIGVQRKWIQKPPKADWVHFDISLEKKAKALAAGAVLTDKYGPIRFLAGQGSTRHQRLVAMLDSKGTDDAQTKITSA